jgi:hypothetical protein
VPGGFDPDGFDLTAITVLLIHVRIKWLRRWLWTRRWFHGGFDYWTDNGWTALWKFTLVYMYVHVVEFGIIVSMHIICTWHDMYMHEGNGFWWIWRRRLRIQMKCRLWQVARFLGLQESAFSTHQNWVYHSMDQYHDNDWGSEAFQPSDLRLFLANARWIWTFEIYMWHIYSTCTKHTQCGVVSILWYKTTGTRNNNTTLHTWLMIAQQEESRNEVVVGQGRSCRIFVQQRNYKANCFANNCIFCNEYT